jgi:hypothetical protein
MFLLPETARQEPFPAHRDARSAFALANQVSASKTLWRTHSEPVGMKILCIGAEATNQSKRGL